MEEEDEGRIWALSRYVMMGTEEEEAELDSSCSCCSLLYGWFREEMCFLFDLKTCLSLTWVVETGGCLMVRIGGSDEGEGRGRIGGEGGGEDGGERRGTSERSKLEGDILP